MPQIAIAGETYSYNLGDGVIAECIAYLASRVRPESRVTLLDISARPGFGQGHGYVAQQTRRAGLSKRSLRLSNLIKWYGVRRRRALQLWQPILGRAERLIIGGGQLLMDNDLDFPFKIALLGSIARELRLPYHVLACGVGDRWSPLGRHLVAAALAGADSVNVRDSVSRERLVRHFGVVATVSFDPAIWAATVFAPAPAARPVVGLGIIGDREVAVYATASRRQRDMVVFWLQAIEALQAAGYAVELFTNGSLSDEAMLTRVVAHMPASCLSLCARAPHPQSPRELAKRVGSYSGVIAARLHASIIATAYRVPVVGLTWDDKVTAFYQSTGRAENCHNIHDTEPADLPAALELARQRQVTLSELGLWKAQALDAIQHSVGRTVVPQTSDDYEH